MRYLRLCVLTLKKHTQFKYQHCRIWFHLLALLKKRESTLLSASDGELSGHDQDIALLCGLVCCRDFSSADTIYGNSIYSFNVNVTCLHDIYLSFMWMQANYANWHKIFWTLTLSFNPFSNLEEAVFKHVRCPVVVHQSVDSAGRRPRVRVRMCRRVRVQVRTLPPCSYAGTYVPPCSPCSCVPSCSCAGTYVPPCSCRCPFKVKLFHT